MRFVKKFSGNPIKPKILPILPLQICKDVSFYGIIVPQKNKAMHFDNRMIAGTDPPHHRGGLFLSFRKRSRIMNRREAREQAFSSSLKRLLRMSLWKKF